MKKCSMCNKIKSLFDFHKNKSLKDGLAAYCKKCIQSYHQNHKGYKYGITPKQYNELFVKQNGVCAICGYPETHTSKYGKMRHLNIDHCHKTGKVRGLLCVLCNTGLGGFQDRIDILASAMSYIQKFA